MTSGKARIWLIPRLAALVAACAVMMPFVSDAAEGKSLWPVYEQALKGAKYVDLTHTITPTIPVWAGFADSTFAPARAGSDTEGFAKKGDVYTYEKHGFEATEYALRTDQLGTQLDPPAHWAPEYPAIDELPATYAIRPLVVISIVDQVKANPNYSLQVADIEAWEKKHGRIPEGSVVFVRSDWSKAWPDPKLATRPGSGDRSARDHRLSEVRRRPWRLRALYRRLSAGLDLWRNDRCAGCPVAEIGEAPALRCLGRHARALRFSSSSRRGCAAPVKAVEFMGMRSTGEA